MRLTVCLAMLAGMVCVSAKAEVYSPWVSSEHTPDFRDPARFRQFGPWKDLKDQDLAVAVWKYLTDPITGTYHFTDMYELTREPHWEVKLVQDPMRILNVYGFAVCSMHSAMTAGLFKGMGYEEARLAGWETYHATPEIYWGGDWRYVDIDERAYILDDKGEIASGIEVFERPEWWEPSSRAVKPFYPQNGGLKGVQTMARHGPPYYAYGWYDGGYTPDFVLRPGERVERFFGPQGYWRYTEAYKEGSTRRIVSREPRGPKSGEYSQNTYGNARFDYEPKIGSGYLDYPQGAWSDRNVRLGEQGLVLAVDGQARSTFYFQYPYIIVPQNGDLGDPEDDWDACVVRFASGVKTRLMLSADNGVTWQDVSDRQGVDETIPANSPRDSGGMKAIDLTRHVAGKYAFWLRFEFDGKAGEAALQALKVTTWTQLAPISLPRLKAGTNRMTYAAGDKYGLNTCTIPITPDCSEIEQLRPYLHGPFNYDAERRRDRFQGPVTFRLEAPEGSQIEWLHVSAGLWVEYESGRPVVSGDRFLVALNEPKDFQPVWQAAVPDWVDHWYFRGQKEVKLPRPAKTVYVRIEPTHGLLNTAFYLHVSRPGRTTGGMMAVTHKFRAGGQERSVTKELTEAGSYEVVCEGEPENVSVAYSVPSVKAGQGR